jgi:CHAT domain-containing protein
MMAAMRVSTAALVVLFAFTTISPPLAYGQFGPRRPGVGQGGGGGFGAGPGQGPGGGPGGGMRGGPPPGIDDDGAKAGKFGMAAIHIMEAVSAGEGRAALAEYEKAARAAEARGDRGIAIRAYHAAALAAIRLGLVASSIDHGARAIALAPPADDMFATRALVSSHTGLGQAYRLLGDVARARRTFEDGLAFTRSPQGLKFARNIAVAKSGLLDSMSRLELAQGDRAKAQAYVEEATQLVAVIPLQGATDHLRRIVNTHLTGTHMQMASIAMAGQGWDAAAAALTRAGHFAAQTGRADTGAAVTIVSAQLALARGDAPAALTQLGRARAALEASGRRSLLGGMDVIAATAYALLGKVDDALIAIRSAIARIEESRGEFIDASQRATYLEQQQDIYQTAVRLALRGSKPDEAFALAERSRSRAFLDLLGSQTVLSKGRTRALVQEETRLRAALHEATAIADAANDEARVDAPKARQRAAAAARDYQAFLERVRKENGEQASMMTVEPVTLAEIQTLLPPDTTLLEYLVGDKELVVWIIDRAGMEVRRTPVDRARLAAEVRDFRAAIAARAPVPEVEARAQALYDTLVGPAQGAIKGSRLLIVPHDVLHYLPFGALRTGNGKWLVEAYGLATVPSASVLKFLTGKGTSSNDRVLAVGNPDLGPALALRYAEREVRAIGDKFRAAATVLIRADATEKQAKELGPQAGVLHFAVHGEMNEKDPMSSALLLGPGGGDDGRLEVREIFGLDLNAKLVVLSACETGLGSLSRGDELVGLQRAFLYAGTPAVVTTLWKVDDRASFMLMRAFYDSLAAKGAGEALRSAQRGLMVDFPHPYAWAGFGLTGTAR